MPQGTGVGDLDFEFLDGFHLEFFSEEKKSLPRVQGLESEDSTGWVKRGEEGGGVDLWEDADSTEIGHEFEKGKEEFGEPVGVSFSSLDSKVAVEEFDGEEEFGSGFGGRGEEVQGGEPFVVVLVLKDGNPFVELRSGRCLDRKVEDELV